MKFAMLSDTHYISRRMIADKSDRELMLQPAVTEQAVRQAAEKSDVLFIIGDLVNDGDRYSHEDFAEFLRGIKAQGKKIYVLFATHDYHHHRAYVRVNGEKVQYISQPWEKPFFDKENVRWREYVKEEFRDLSEEECTPTLVEAMAPEEIWETYREFGADGAYSVNEANFSYCVEFDDKTRCLMLNDFFRNEEALKDKSPTYSPSCFRWIKQMKDEAERDGKYLFICSHHPLLPAVPAHRLGAGKENRDMRAPVVGHTLADMGFDLVFTGHSHFCNVDYLKSEKGNIIYDITTPSVRFYPPCFRMIDLDSENHKVSYDINYIDIPEGCEIEEESLFEHYHRDYYGQYYRTVTGSNEFVKKFFDTVTVKDIYFLVKKQAKLSAAEFDKIKDTKLFDFVIEAAFNMLIGDGKFTPETPEYRVMMPLCAKLDSIIDTQPFVDVKNKYLGGYSVSEVIEPLMFKNTVADRADTVDLTKEPEKKYESPVYTSAAGDVLMGLVWLLAVVLSPVAPAVAGIGIPILTLKKKFNKDDKGLYYKYR